MIRTLTFALIAATIATPAMADGKASVQAVVSMRVAYTECGLSAPPELALDIVRNAIQFTQISDKEFSEGVIRAAEYYAQEHRRAGTIGKFCAEMARIYGGAR